MLNKKDLTKLLAVTVLSTGMAMAPAAVKADVDNTYKWESFNNLDVDESGYLETGEYQSYAFGRADWDDDGYLEETEWASYTDVYYDTWEMEYDSYTYYDTDGDGFIDRSEFNEVPTAGLYDAWDYDDDTYIGDEDWDRVTTYYYDND